MKILLLFILITQNNGKTFKEHRIYDFPFSPRYVLMHKFISEHLCGANKVSMYCYFGSTNGEKALVEFYYDVWARDTLRVRNGEIENHTVYDTTPSKQVTCSHQRSNLTGCDIENLWNNKEHRYYSDQEFAYNYDKKGRVVLIYETAQSKDKREKARKKPFFDRLFGPPPRVDSISFTYNTRGLLVKEKFKGGNEYCTATFRYNAKGQLIKLLYMGDVFRIRYFKNSPGYKSKVNL